MNLRTAVLSILILTSALNTSLIPGFSSGLRPQTSDQISPQSAIHNPQSKELLPGTPIERELKGGETHSYRVTLAAGQYLHAVVNQHGIDVVVTVFGPDGQTMTEVDSFNSSQGPEPVTVVAEASGDYRLDVRVNEFWRQEEETVRKQTASGRYAVWIEERREATPEDRTCLAAKTALAEGLRLRAQWTAESFRRSIERWEEALPLFRALGDRHEEAETLRLIGWAYGRLGEPQKALEYLGEALPLWRAVGERRADSLEHEEFIAKCQPAPLTGPVGNRQGEAETLYRIAEVYSELGEHQKALDFLTQALALYRAMENRNRYAEANALRKTGEVYWLLGEPEKALESLGQALPLYRALHYYAGEAWTLTNIGEVYHFLGDDVKALDFHHRALSLAHGEARYPEAAALHNIGLVYASLGDKQKAIEYYGQALARYRVLGDRNGEAATLAGIARVECDWGNLIEARAQIEAALNITESQRTKVVSPGLRTSFLASKQNYYELYLDLLMRLHNREPANGHDANALKASERARARSLLEILTEARADIRQGVKPALLERERGLQQQLDAKAERLTRLLSSKYTEEQKTTAEKELSDLLMQSQDVQAQIRASSPRYAALTQPQPLSLKEIQQQVLDDDTLLLEYALGDERSFLWAVTPNSIHSFELPKRAEIEAAARRVYELLTTRNQSKAGETPEQKRQRVAQADAEYVKAAAALSQMLLAPVAAPLGTKRLLIVAEGTLQYVPFAALPRPVSLVTGHWSLADSKRPRTNDQGRMTNDTRPLVVDHEIVSLPSASALAVLRKELAGRQPAAKTVAVLADPVFQSNDARVKQIRMEAAKKANETPALPGAPSIEPDVERSARESGATSFQRLRFSRVEAEGIAALAPAAAGLKAVDFEANKLTATSVDLSQYRIVHFATHGLLNSQHPELSGVVLSLVDEEGEPQDGFLRFYEIYNLKLNADLVVLSACQTALGKEVKGEGLVGLTRGFMYAGAARVVASLWNVQDKATAELMRRFYQAMLKDGLRPAAALRAAQVAMWKEKRAPYYWAAFALQGEWK
ncbi:MAG: CHAT domain-containing protein [Acidobacteria bacterium]|nr:CHAT domain-containing protein [Acidobacteriota bacterium]